MTKPHYMAWACVHLEKITDTPREEWVGSPRTIIIRHNT